MKPIFAPALLAVAWLAVPGCDSKPGGSPGGAPAPAASGTPAAAPAPAGIDACSLLSAADIQAATGKALASSDHGPGNAQNVCFFRLEGGDQMNIAIYTSSAEKTFQSAKGDPVPGVGDRATWNKDLHILAVLKGTQVSFVISMPFGMAEKGEEALAGAKALAAKILPKV